MRPLVLHASSKAETYHPRRVLHIEHADSFEVGDGLRIAIEIVTGRKNFSLLNVLALVGDRDTSASFE